MAKHRRFSDKPKDKPSSDATAKSVDPTDENNLYYEGESTVDFSATSPKTNKDFKSIILSGTKYAYIIAAVTLLSGIFTPLTIGEEFETVAMGMISIFLGLGGGIAIFLGLKNQKFTTLMICSGLGMMVVSLIFIYELADRSLFG